MRKIYYYLNDINEEKLFKSLSKVVKLDKNYKNLTEKQKMNYVFQSAFKGNSMDFVIALSKQEALSEDITSKIDEKVSTLNKLGCDNKNIIVSVLDDSHKFTDEEWHKIERLNKYLKRHNEKNKHKNIKFGFDDQSKTWDIEKVKNANDQLNNTANEIRAKHLSPLEELIEAYNIVTKRYYKLESRTEHPAESRSVYGLLNSENIVCSGYAEYYKNILKLVDSNNIKCYSNAIQVGDKYNKYHFDSRHENNIIYLKDNKYNIEGYYYLDSCWDYRRENTNNFAHFLIPLTDIKYFYNPIRQDYLFKYIIMESGVKLGKRQQAIIKKENIKYNQLDRIYMSKLNHEKTRIFTHNKGRIADVSFSQDQFVYTKNFIKDVLKSNIFKSTVKDIVPFVLDKKLDENIKNLENLKQVKNCVMENYSSINKGYTKQFIVEPDLFVEAILEELNCYNFLNYATIFRVLNKTIEKDEETENKKTVSAQLIKIVNDKIKEINTEIKTLTKNEKNLINNFKYRDIFETIHSIKPHTPKEYQTSFILDETLKYLSTPIPMNKLKAALLTCFKDENAVEDIIKNSMYYQKCFMYYPKTENAISKEIMIRKEKEEKEKELAK